MSPITTVYVPGNVTEKGINDSGQKLRLTSHPHCPRCHQDFKPIYVQKGTDNMCNEKTENTAVPEPEVEKTLSGPLLCKMDEEFWQAMREMGVDEKIYDSFCKYLRRRSHSVQ